MIAESLLKLIKTININESNFWGKIQLKFKKSFCYPNLDVSVLVR